MAGSGSRPGESDPGSLPGEVRPGSRPGESGPGSLPGESDPAPARSRMWGGRFTRPPADAFERLNRSLPVDARLWREDLAASRAWACALGAAGVLSREEEAALLAGLERVEVRMPTALAQDPPDEDVHSLVERLLYEEAGEVAGKLHTGRSRNDQVATDARMWARGTASDLGNGVAHLQRALLEAAEGWGDLMMPGYTHLQRAQPLRAGHWLLSHFWRLERDRQRLALAGRSASVLPLGSGALAGCPFPVDRELLREILGFDAISENSLDAVSDRDWACELLFALAVLGVHLSGLAEDIIIFTTAEFGFMRLDDGVASGSSLMPQKRNPDALELARAGGAAAIGDLTALLSLLKGLPSGYNKDLQEDKRILFRAADAAAAVLPVLKLVLETLEPDPARMREALDEGMLATDLADRLVESGVPFRVAHERIGEIAREAERRGVSLSTVAEESAAEESAAAEGGRTAGGSSAGSALLFEASADRREAPGGTGAGALAEQMRRARARLAAVSNSPRCTPSDSGSRTPSR